MVPRSKGWIRGSVSAPARPVMLQRVGTSYVHPRFDFTFPSSFFLLPSSFFLALQLQLYQRLCSNVIYFFQEPIFLIPWSACFPVPATDLPSVAPPPVGHPPPHPSLRHWLLRDFTLAFSNTSLRLLEHCLFPLSHQFHRNYASNTKFSPKLAFPADGYAAAVAYWPPECLFAA